MEQDTVPINRAPVLTLWAAVVAMRIGYSEDEALTLGKAVAGLNAQAKGRSIGVFGTPHHGHEKGKPKKTGLGEDMWVQLCSRPVPAKHTPQGVRAVVGADPIDAEKVRKYLAGKFGDDLVRTRAAMEALAQAYEPAELEGAAYGLYETFRPGIEAGKSGWGQKGSLDLDLLRRLASRRR